MKSSLPPSSVPVRFDAAKIDALLSDIDQSRLPGVAVGISLDGKCVYRRGVGLANMELPLVLSPSVRMRIGSVTKPFTSLLYLVLCEEGRAQLDDPIEKYFPEFHPVIRAVTIRQLLANVSGIRDAAAVKLEFSGIDTRPVSSDEVLSLYRDTDDVSVPPDTTWMYNNGGYWIVGAAIERITNRPLEEVFQTRIFAPLGMHDTVLRRWDRECLANSASCHMQGPNGNWVRADYGMDNFAGAGAISSTIDDMLKWMANMDAPTVGSDCTWTAMKTPHRLVNGASTGYGLGLAVEQFCGVDLLRHAGGGIGCNAQMLKAPLAGLDIMVMSNRADVSSMVLAEKVLESCLPGLGPPQQRGDLVPCVGVFRSPATGMVIQLKVADAQQIVSVNGFDVPFAPDSNGSWVPASTRVLKWAVTPVGDPEHPSSLRMNEFGNQDVLIRVAEGRAPELDLIAGTYESGSIGTRLLIEDALAGPSMRSYGRFGVADFGLERLANGIWRARSQGLRPYGGVLQVSKCDGVAFSNVNNRMICFTRIT